MDLNPVGRVIWENCNECKNIEILIKKIQPYFVAKITAEQKDIIERFIVELKNMELLNEYDVRIRTQGIFKRIKRKIVFK